MVTDVPSKIVPNADEAPLADTVSPCGKTGVKVQEITELGDGIVADKGGIEGPVDGAVNGRAEATAISSRFAWLALLDDGGSMTVASAANSTPMTSPVDKERRFMTGVPLCYRRVTRVGDQNDIPLSPAVSYHGSASLRSFYLL